MLIWIVLFILFGIIIGIFAGLCPGIHVNTTIPLILSLSIFIDNPYYLAVMIVSVSCTEMFLDFIPSIYFGAPDADTALSVLPGHNLLFEGRGYEAILLSVIGGIGSLIIGSVFIFLIANWFELLYTLIRPYMHLLLLGVISFMIISEKELSKILSALLIIILSGFLGILTLNSSLVPGEDVLFPIFTGMFGLSGLLMSINENSKIPIQNMDNKLLISNSSLVKSVVFSSLAGIITGFLPAIGISEAAVMMQYIIGSNTSRTFLVTASGINVANDIFSFISLWLVSNPRSGVSVAIEKILFELSSFDVLLLIGVTFLTAGISAVLTLYLGKLVPKLLHKIDYRSLNIVVIILMIFLILVLTGFSGLLVALTSASIGVLCVQLKIRRSHCMGVLLVSVLLFFLELDPIIISILNI